MCHERPNQLMVVISRHIGRTRRRHARWGVSVRRSQPEEGAATPSFRCGNASRLIPDAICMTEHGMDNGRVITFAQKIDV
jgi:hypothetical protein